MAAEKHYSYFAHEQCEYFPCHEEAEKDDFNCLFCYCPLYTLGDKCGGDFTYLANGIKDCSRCLWPHKRENYATITARFNEIVLMMAQKG